MSGAGVWADATREATVNVRWWRVVKYVFLVFGLQILVALPLMVVLNAAVGLSLDAAVGLAVLAYLPCLIGAFALLAYRTQQGAGRYVMMVAAISVGGNVSLGSGAGIAAVMVGLAACAAAGLGLGVGLRRLRSGRPTP